MKKTRVFLISLVLLFSMSGAFASLATRPSISASLGGVFCHPTASYLKEYPGDPEAKTPWLRTSYSFGFDLRLLDLSYVFDRNLRNAVSLNAGVSYVNVSESLPYGISILKPYSGLGLVAGVGYSFNYNWSLSAGYRFLACHYISSSTRFVAHEVELCPSFTFGSLEMFNFMVSLPVTALIKADSVSIRASIALSFQVDSTRFKRSGK